MKVDNVGLSDYYTAMAMQGYIAHHGKHQPGLLRECYGLVDEMLKVRESVKGNGCVESCNAFN